MNIFEMFKELEKDDTKIFINGYNRVQAGFDSYELLFTNAEGEEMTVLMSNWVEAKEDWVVNKHNHIPEKRQEPIGKGMFDIDMLERLNDKT